MYSSERMRRRKEYKLGNNTVSDTIRGCGIGGGAGGGGGRGGAGAGADGRGGGINSTGTSSGNSNANCGSGKSNLKRKKTSTTTTTYTTTNPTTTERNTTTRTTSNTSKTSKMSKMSKMSNTSTTRVNSRLADQRASCQRCFCLSSSSSLSFSAFKDFNIENNGATMRTCILCERLRGSSSSTSISSSKWSSYDQDYLDRIGDHFPSLPISSTSSSSLSSSSSSTSSISSLLFTSSSTSSSSSYPSSSPSSSEKCFNNEDPSRKFIKDDNWLTGENDNNDCTYANPRQDSKLMSNVVRWRNNLFYWRLAFSIAIILALNFPPITSVAGYQGRASRTRRDGVCQSIDIRNSVNQFARLQGCRIVEGFVQILLIDRADDSSFTNITFPDLVEITEYLVLYRVNGLRSVGRLFPNLTVIRGHSLFINYALVAFEMMDLQEIGLHSLTHIQRGSVRFEKNPALCYVDTIDWDIIAKSGKGEHVISGNKPKNGCPICERDCMTRLTKPDETLCWNRQHCQRLCDRKCGDGSCDDLNRCCHPTCLGGCTGPTANDCKVCKNVMVSENQCEERCPNGTYEFMNRRCITEEECHQMAKPREALNVAKDNPYKPFNGSCIIECPAGYMDEDIDNRTSCKKCHGPCLKECSGASIDSIASAQKLRGCTHIMGSLEIQIRGGKNIVNELEDSLNMVEEIDGYLKIVRSFPLISLNFLKSLRIIHGNYLDNGKYTLAVLDNQNLQELWDWSTHAKIELRSKDGPAKVFFHFNPKLCFHKIETLRIKSGLEEFTDLEVAPNSNGDKVACNVTELKTIVTKTTSDAALIEWEQFTHHDPRSLLGYVVYFIEAPNENVTMYDGRDACGGDGWRVDDVSAVEGTARPITTNYTEPEKPSYLSHILTQLKPFTQYAFYVKTYTIATERSGAQSKVTYFMTKPHAPSAPRGLSTYSNSSSELIVSWLPPLRMNGNLTHYRVVGHWVPDDSTFIDQRNYCDEPMSLPEKKSMSVLAEEERKRAEEEKELAKIPETMSCDCTDREYDQLMREKEVSSSIAFEDALHNQVYIKRIDSRRRRDTSEMFDSVKRREHNYYAGTEFMHEKLVNHTYIIFDREVPSHNLTFIMRHLRHFAYYNIEVQACRALVMNDTNDTCSTKSMKTYRTLPLESADNIPSNTFKVRISGENNSLTTVTLSWAEPVEPNGLIVTYQIEYKRVDIQNIKATVVCITRRDFTKAGNSYVLRDLPSGNYSVKVRATSLAGNGNFTEAQYFLIREYTSLRSFWILFWVILIILLIIISIIAFYLCKKRFMNNVPNRRLIATVNPEYVSSVYVPDEWEVPRRKIQVLKELGNGSFGMVYEGLARDVVKGKPEVRCAVKTVNENATDRERIEFLNEASVMKAFNTHHVVRLLGVVSQGQPTLVVMELMVNGDLKTYLRSHRPDVCENFSRQPPTLKRILQMAIEIADGMGYLAAKKFVHRDLAARNCMVAEDLTVKIGDFGMTRDIYETDYYRKGTKGLLPVRWMAPESLKDGVFTSFSDVWSYGVVLWEMVTLASQPYQGLSNDQVLRYVIEGGVMERPENCPDSLYNLMRRTWCHKATRRPTFIDIATILLPEVNSVTFERVSFYHSPEGIDARNQNKAHSSHIDKDLELTTLTTLREEEIAEGDEDSPLRQDFGDFASFEPGNIKHNLSSRFKLGETSRTSKMVKMTTPTTTPTSSSAAAAAAAAAAAVTAAAAATFLEMNPDKVPLKAVFDEFDGLSGGSLAASKDTLNLPFAEDSLKSFRSSPYTRGNNLSRGNIGQASSIARSMSPHSLIKRHKLQHQIEQLQLEQRAFTDSPGSTKSKFMFHDYENSCPEEILANIERQFMITQKVDLSLLESLDIDIDIDEKEEDRLSSSNPEHVNKPDDTPKDLFDGNNRST